VGKRLIDIDESSLVAAQAELGTPTIKATVNEALRLAGGRRKESVQYAFQTLADAPLLDRDAAWR
jgi:Arc/MetJ family transcription regulator